MLGRCLLVSAGKLNQWEVALLCWRLGKGQLGAETNNVTSPTAIHCACPCPHDGMKVQTTHHLLGDGHARMLRVEKKK